MSQHLLQRCKQELAVFVDEECGFRAWIWFPNMPLAELVTWWSTHENISHYAEHIDSPYKLPGEVLLMETPEDDAFWTNEFANLKYCKAWILGVDSSYLITNEGQLVFDKSFPEEAKPSARKRLARYCGTHTE